MKRHQRTLKTRRKEEKKRRKMFSTAYPKERGKRERDALGVIENWLDGNRSSRPQHGRFVPSACLSVCVRVSLSLCVCAFACIRVRLCRCLPSVKKTKGREGEEDSRGRVAEILHTREGKVGRGGVRFIGLTTTSCGEWRQLVEVLRSGEGARRLPPLPCALAEKDTGFA